jgi:hypothetical protein
MVEIKKNDDAAAAPSPQTGGGPKQVVDMREVGVTGLRRFSGFIYDEFSPELIGWKGIAQYKEMAYNDATVKAILFAIKMLCRKVPWFAEAASEESADQEASEFLESCMNDMSQTWIDTIDEILSMLEYGYALEEIVYKKRNGADVDPAQRSKYKDGRIGWRKLSIRSQDTIYRWQFDDHGGIRGAIQIAPPHYTNVVMPIEKLLLFRTTISKNNPEGVSLLRGAWRAWRIKKDIENIEAIGIERDLAGLPVALVPPEILSANASQGQKDILARIKDITVNVRRNAQEGVVFPSDYDQNGKPRYEFKLLSTGGTRQFNTTEIINRWDQRIAMTVLADFVLLGADKVGSFALASSKTNIFSTAIGAFLDIIADVFNRYAIPRLFALNSFEGITDYPKIKHGDLGAVDLNELSTYIQRLSQSGMPIFPNEDLEKHLLELAGLPVAVGKAAAPSVQVDAPAGISDDAEEIPAEPAKLSDESNIENLAFPKRPNEYGERY